jgi:protein SCO1/2
MASALNSSGTGSSGVRQPHHAGRFAAMLLPVLFVVLTGCGITQKHYALRGRVIAKASNQVTVSQEEIPGFMPAMTMPYTVKDPEAMQQVQPGEFITADLIVTRGNKDHWLENIVVIGTGRESVSTTTDANAIEVENGAPVAGQPIPDVKLVNQDRKTIHLSDFKGKVLLVTFFYTRCPFPDFCPLLTSEFASIQRELLKTPDVYKKTHLVSITLDPAYDTAPVLRKYALSYLNNDSSGFAHWDFVSTSPADLATFAAAFGLTYSQTEKQFTHNTRTVLVGSDGTVASIWDGTAWRQPELIDAIRRATLGG